MKTLTLLAPDFAALDTIWRHPLPFALWPVGSQPLISHWMDDAVRQGVDQVDIYATDRPAEIRHLFEGTNYWSRKVEVHALRNDASAPSGAIRMDRLPAHDLPGPPLETPEQLLAHWLNLQRQWLVMRKPGGVSIDVETVPGGWVGPQARVHPQAKLHPPYWIGARAEIGAGCEIGPNALIGEGSILDASVQVEDAFVLADSFLGQNTRLYQAIAQGGILVDIRRGCRVDITENFIMAPITRQAEKVSAVDKARAVCSWLLLAPFALLWPSQGWDERQVLGRDGKVISLKTGRRGPLLISRWPWLKEILRGNLLWIGLLPRGEAEYSHVDPETAERLRHCPPGLFSWADLQGCHDSREPDEWIHAAYQALQKDGTVKLLLRRKLFHLACTIPPAP